MDNAPVPQFGDYTPILSRQSSRRLGGIPTVSLLLGPIGAGIRAWRRWANVDGRCVIVANQNVFPFAEWVCSVAQQIDLPALAVKYLARRGERDSDEFLGAWQAKTSTDRIRFWNTLEPVADDDLLQTIAEMASDRGSPSLVAAALRRLGERIAPLIVRLAPTFLWPSVLFASDSMAGFSSVGYEAAKWAQAVPAIPVAVATTEFTWDGFLADAAESRTKALLREGEILVPGIDQAAVERTLAQSRATSSTIAAVIASGADALLVESAVLAVEANATSPENSVSNQRARSAAEKLLFEFLESLAETTGRFELNAKLDFQFGRRPVEVDLFCRERRVVIEIDGYFHFLGPDCYRRDRTKDWELQQLGYLVLRFMAEDIVAQLELVRDRILQALAPNVSENLLERHTRSTAN